ncbi:MAG: cytochrome c biogenesis protein ResB [Thermoleophilia bacterium]|nr:cytochrome c biogenesis protein ResB [Thermoleophilia bacterium]
MSDPHVRGVEPAWVFAEQTTRLGSLSVLFRKVDEEELRRLSEETLETPKEQAKSLGSVRVDYQDARFEFPVEQCMQKAVAVGETGLTLKVLRYMPHALLDAGNRLRNASNRPVNPTIEVELAGPEGTVRRPAFAKFPEFWSTHDPKNAAGLKVVFVASDAVAPSAPISVLSGPEGKLYARFAPDGQPVVIKELTVGKPCESPWVGRRLTVLRQFDRARVKQTVIPMEPVRKKSRVPAVLLEVKSAAGTERAWLQKYHSHPVTVGGTTYDLIYGNKRVPLGFSVTLKEAAIGYYPGTGRPRSYESLITILDPVSVRKLNRVISMNNPAKFGGYTFYQSDMRPRGGRMSSILSVSWDPGQPIVFAGYIGLMAGMLLLLGRRIADRRSPAVRCGATAGPADRRASSALSRAAAGNPVGRCG